VRSTVRKDLACISMIGDRLSDLDRVRIALTGFVGEPGVITMYAVDGPALQGPLSDLVNFWKDLMPPVVDLKVETGGDTIDDVNGDLTGSWVGDAQPGYTGAGAAAYSAPCGACVTWLTPIIRDGHRIKGRSFVVPLSDSAYEDNGSIEPTTLGVLQSSAADFVTAAGGNLRIWHRPRLAQVASPGHRALTAHDGSQAAVTSSTVRDKVAVLRSRRD
jgi:hypothetical protein